MQDAFTISLDSLFYIVMMTMDHMQGNTFRGIQLSVVSSLYIISYLTKL